MIDFDPFGKPLREVELADFDRLSENNVSEGVYVEFKQSFPDPHKVSKVIASFANTHGGYFVIGLAEEELTNIASGKIGVDTTEISNPKERIRDIVRDHLHPSPNFDSRVIQRHDYENYALIVVEVPESQDAPHIHSTGKIYTRTGEGSDPISPETDRWTLDKLYERRNEWNEKIEEFCTPDITLTRGQTGDTEHLSDGQPFLEIYGIPSTLGDPMYTDALRDVAGVKTILESSKFHIPDEDDDDPAATLELGTEFAAYRASSDAVVAQAWFRDEEGLDTASAPETVKFFADGGMKALLGVPQLQFPENPSGAWSKFFHSVEGNIGYIRFLDGTNLLLKVLALLNSYISLLDEYGQGEGSNRELNFKARVRHGNRTVLMFDGDWYSDIIEEYGPPILYEDIVDIPRTGTLTHRNTASNLEFLLHSLALIMEGFGLPWEHRGMGAQELTDLLLDSATEEYTDE